MRDGVISTLCSRPVLARPPERVPARQMEPDDGNRTRCPVSKSKMNPRRPTAPVAALTLLMVAAAAAPAARAAARLVPDADRPLRSGEARGEGPAAQPANGPPHPDPPRHLRPDRPPARAGRSARLPGGPIRHRV